MNKMIQITEASKPTELIETINGEIEYQKWCHNEVMRISKDPTRQAEVRFDKMGRCSLWADNVSDPVYYPSAKGRLTQVRGSNRARGNYVESKLYKGKRFIRGTRYQTKGG